MDRNTAYNIVSKRTGYLTQRQTVLAVLLDGKEHSLDSLQSNAFILRRDNLHGRISELRQRGFDITVSNGTARLTGILV